MFKHSGQIDESIRLVMDNCSEEEFKSYRNATSIILTDILEEVLNPIFGVHSDLIPQDLRKSYNLE